MYIAALIPAAGRGLRMKNRNNKQFLTLGDRPVLAHTLHLFTHHPKIQEILLVGRQEEMHMYKRLVEKYSNPQKVQILAGGKERAHSVWQGLSAVQGADYVLIHDGARPLLPLSLLDTILTEVSHWDAVTPGLSIMDTVKLVAGDWVKETIPRESLQVVQTPQAFRFDLIYQAYKAGLAQNFSGSDDVSFLERVNGRIKVVPGSRENIKITTPEDLLFGEMILQARQERKERE